MKTLKEYADFLYENGYKESFAPYTFLDGHLEIVEFIKNGFHLNLYVTEMEEFAKYFETLEPGTEYEVEYHNYEVNNAFIESPICNVSNFFDGTTNGIELVSEPEEYNKHTLDLFELCIGFQKINLLEHELFIMTCRMELLSWAKDNLIPILEKYDYYIDYNSFFDTKNEKCNSNPKIDFKHLNREELVIETDCLTGQPIIWHSRNRECGDSNITKELYGKTKDEVFNTLLEEIWKKDDLKFGYIFNDNPHETVDTYREVYKLIDCIRDKEKRDINFDIIPERYNHLVEQYKSL